MTDDEIKAKCEALFQAGGPRHYLFYVNGNGVPCFVHCPTRSDVNIRASGYDNPRAFSRRKNVATKKYEWKEIRL